MKGALSGDEVVSLLKKGGVIAYPTDTAYGLGASVASISGIKKVFKIKGRERNKPLSVAVASLSQAKEIAEFSNKALKLWRKFLPGALTVVLPLRPGLRRKKIWRLISGGTGTIGLRFPDSLIALAIVKKLGKPITATSANLSGEPALYASEDIEKHFADKRFRPDYIIRSRKLKKGRISTVVDCTGNEIKILRQGSIRL